MAAEDAEAVVEGAADAEAGMKAAADAACRLVYSRQTMVEVSAIVEEKFEQWLQRAAAVDGR